MVKSHISSFQWLVTDLTSCYSASWNICPVTILPPQRAVNWSLISIHYFNKLQKLSKPADFEIQAAWKRKAPWNRQQWTPHTTNTQPGTPSPPQPNKAYTGISIRHQTSQCPYKPVQGFFAVETLCPRPVPYSSIY
jgi:hypothetical protein